MESEFWSDWFDETEFGDPPVFGESGPVTFPAVPLTIRVYLALGASPTGDPTRDWAWTEITQYVRMDPPIAISRGRGDGQIQAEPSTCTMTLDNTAGRFVPRNPLGPYYGRIGRNTPIKVAVDPGSGENTRFVGYVSSWPPQWDPTGNANWVQIRADGVLRRLTQGAPPIRSEAYVGSTLPALTQYTLAYWPCEDGSGATSAANWVSGGPPLKAIGAVTFASASVPDGIAAAPSLSSGGQLRASLPMTTSTTDWMVTFGAAVSAAGVRVASWTSGGAFWYVVTAADGVHLWRAVGAVATDLVTHPTVATDSAWYTYIIKASQFGADLSFDIDVRSVTSIPNGFGSSIASATNGQPTAIAFNPLSSANVLSVGHVLVATNGILPQLGDIWGMVGREAPLRFADLCLQAGVAFHLPGVIDSDRSLYSYWLFTYFLADYTGPNYPMGARRVGDVMTLLRECETVSGGEIVERRDGRLGLDVAWSRENQPVALTLDYTQGQMQSISPVDDDRLTRNKATISRTGGSSATVEETLGALGTGSSTGTYDEGLTYNLYDDTQPAVYAGYEVTKGTVDEYRYPTLVFSLARNPGLISAWLASDVGSRTAIANIPNAVSYDHADQIIAGYAESLHRYNWTVACNLAPYKPWRVFTVSQEAGDTSEWRGWMVPDSCVLAVAAGSGDATIQVTTTPLWSVTGDDYPVDIFVGGERMTVTAAASALADAFGRVTANGWGVADTGQSWTASGGPASDYSTDGSIGAVALNAYGTDHDVYIGSQTDADIKVGNIFNVPTLVPAGGSLYVDIMARRTAANTFVGLEFVYSTANTITATLFQRVAGVTTTFGAATVTVLTGQSASTGVISARLRVDGVNVSAKVWAASAAEPTGWQMMGVTTLTTAGPVGVRFSSDGTVSNPAPFTFAFDNFSVASPQTLTVTRSINGVVKAHSINDEVTLANPGVLGLG